MDFNKLNKYTELYDKKKAKIEEDTIVLESIQDSILSMVKTVNNKKLIDNIKFIRYSNTRSNPSGMDLTVETLREVRDTFVSDKIMCPVNMSFDAIENKSERVIQYDLCIKTPVNRFRVLIPVIDNIGVDDLISTNYGAYIVTVLDASYKIIDKISSYDTRDIRNFIYKHIS